MTDSTARTYLVQLYGEDPQGLLWIGGPADGWKGRPFGTIDAAAEYAMELDARGGMGVYHRSTTLVRVPERRGEAADSMAVYYFALDGDVKGPGHKSPDLPSGFADLEEMIARAGFPEPTAWVASGGGFYPQWRFTEPIDVRGEEERKWVTDAFTLMADHFIGVAKGMGWKLDNVRDLARVFRLPGTTNRKTDEHVVASVVAGAGSGETFDLGVLASKARRAGPIPRESASSAAPDLLFDEPTQDHRHTEEQAKKRIEAAFQKMKAALGPENFNTPINHFAKFCSHFPWLVSRDECARMVTKALTPHGRTATDNDYLKAIHSAYVSTESNGDWVAVKVEAVVDGGPLSLPAPGMPMDVAQAVAPLYGKPLTFWRDDFYEHTGTHWSAFDQVHLEGWLYRLTHQATYRVRSKEGEWEIKPWNPYTKTVAWAVDALKKGVLLRGGESERGIFLSNGVLSTGRELRPHNADRFNLSSLPFPYDPDAECPEWLKFLESTLPGDRQAHESLAEWFGYVLSGRTDLHKIAVLVGPPRCGKGTISRVLQAMVGREGWAAPTLARLPTNFGMESLIGKSLAVMGDVRWTSKHVIDAVPIMLGVSGEDGFSVPRKNKDDWIGQLDTRLMLMSNDAPVFTDASGAMAGRMVYVAFGRSFAGREDRELQGRLMPELSGILNWALDGLDRLNKQGQFTQSSNATELRDEVDRDSSPVAAWVEDRCVLDETAEMTLDTLLSNYRDWLTEEHMAFSPSLNRLSRDIRSAFGDKGVVIERKSNGVGGKHRVVTGIRIIAGGSVPDNRLFDNAE